MILLQQAGKPPRRTSRQNTTKSSGQNISCSLKKKAKHTQWVRAPKMDQVQQEMPDLTRPEGKGGKSQRRMVSEWRINRLPGLLAVKIAESRSVLPTDPHTCPQPPPTSVASIGGGGAFSPQMYPNSGTSRLRSPAKSTQFLLLLLALRPGAAHPGDVFGALGNVWLVLYNTHFFTRGV